MGEVTTQRHIPSGENETRAFRFVSPAVDAGSIRANWQENGNSPVGFGTHITGSGGASNGFDPTASNAVSMFIFDNDVVSQSNGNAWVAVANTQTTNLLAGEPYRLFIRGDRNIDLSTNEATPNNTTLRATGTLKVGNTVANLGNNPSNFVFVGNPYQAVVNMNSITYNGVENGFMYAWDPNTNDGTYVVVALDGSAPNPSSSGATRFLQPGQAVFLRTDPSVGVKSVTFTEASKAEGNQSLATFSTSTVAFVNLRLYNTADFVNGKKEQDAVGLRFLEDGSNAIDSKDAPKLGNPGLNLALLNGNTPLSIESRAFPEATEEIQLFINNIGTENYTFRFHSENMPENTKVFINDAYLETATEIEVGIDTYAFEVDETIEGSISPFRFSLSFESTTLSINEFVSFTSVEVYPNPTSNVLHVKSNLLVSQNTQVKVIDMLGREILQQELYVEADGILKLNTNNIHQGLYIINVTTSNAEVISERFIKK